MTTCDMSATCTEPVTHLGNKGYLYCATHAGNRRGVESVRKMRQWELRWISEGRTLPTYRVEPEPAPVEDDTEPEESPAGIFAGKTGAMPREGDQGAAESVSKPLKFRWVEPAQRDPHEDDQPDAMDQGVHIALGTFHGGIACECGHIVNEDLWELHCESEGE